MVHVITIFCLDCSNSFTNWSSVSGLALLTICSSQSEQSDHFQKYIQHWCIKFTNDILLFSEQHINYFQSLLEFLFKWPLYTILMSFPSHSIFYDTFPDTVQNCSTYFYFRPISHDFPAIENASPLVV